ncbi:MAG: AMP-binding protein [Bacteroidetes bacterium]|nr:AMP-binding protein [Bacteroidota bacterium]
MNIIETEISTIGNGKIKLIDFNVANIAYILFTSGSTGVPKGVPISVSNLDAFLDAFFQLGYHLNENDRFLQMFDLTFDLSIMSYMAPLCIGACVYTVPSEGIKYMQVYKLLEQYDLTFTLMVPSIITHLRQYFDEIRLDKLRYSLFCGEALYEDVVLEWSKCVPNALVENVYGPTEATIFCTRYKINSNGSNKQLNGILCIGAPMKNVGVAIINDNLQFSAPFEKGELCLSGSQVTSGYWKNDLKNAEAFFEKEGIRYYKTGDLCFMDGEGDVFYSGRVDFQVKIQGFRVELGEIEFHARKFLESAAVVAVATENSQNIWQIYLFVEGDLTHFEELQNYLKLHLPVYMVPSKITGVKMFPLNTNGKIDRKALIHIFNSHVS